MSEPILLTTWAFGQAANGAGWPGLDGGGRGLDAVEAVCRHVELDESVESVGLGGLPDAAGDVTLDGCVMQGPARCGSVCCLTWCPHPVTVARRVMEASEHVMLAGPGADAFAASEGLEKGDVLSARARSRWAEGRSGPPGALPPTAPSTQGGPLRPSRGDTEPTSVDPRPPGDGPASDASLSHDTVAVLALDTAGLLSGACSTSGMAWKIPGRVGDSPLIGHGLYVHPSHGAAAATGKGELVMGLCSSFDAVERMRAGASPLEALGGVLRRIRDEHELAAEDQIGMIALTPHGEWAGASLRAGYSSSVRTRARDEVVDPDLVLLD
ncbi:MAG: isoaspartyl peptidase/L-asparaginase [Planctomycetota bacterium]|nr:isoaspartyl peptidase/L-asparaginase [Planctomycetota bacterium]MDP6989126.1 isoaspartyl peptidase/L-asparaginase [Planctomycetota bacterium]